MARRDHTTVSIPKTGANEIALIVKYADELPTLIDAAKKIKPGISSATIIKRLTQTLSMPFEELGRIFNALQNLQNLKHTFGSAEIVFEVIAEALDGEISKSWIEKKEAILNALTLYSPDHPFALTWKAERLTTLRENVLRSVDILTDARPVYNSTADQVVQFVITSSLVLQYSNSGQMNSGQMKRLHVELDEADLTELRKVCERAIIKMKTLKSALADTAKWNVEIAGEDDDVAN